MQTQYRREVDGNYLVISGHDCKKEEYTLRMLVNNHPDCFLNLRLSGLNGEPVLMYEVTSLQPVTRIYDRSGVGERELRMVLDGLNDVLKEAHRYLLLPDDIVLDPEYLFYDQNRQRIRFLYVPRYSEWGEGSRKTLAEYLLRHLDHKDPVAVKLGYAFYDRCSDETASLSGILENLDIPDAGREEKKPSRDEQDRGNEKDDAGVLHQQDLNQLREEGKRRKRFRIGKNRKEWKSIAAILGVSLACSILYVFVVWFGQLDMTQAGGLFFGIIALVWFIYRVAIGNKKEQRSVWEGELEDPDEEEAYLEALMTDVYSREPERRIPVTGMEGALSEFGGQIYRPEKYEAFGKRTGRTNAENPGRLTGMTTNVRGDLSEQETEGIPEKYQERETTGISGRHSEKVKSRAEQITLDPIGYTRVLGYAEADKKLILISEDVRRCRDLTVEGGTVRIGKRPDMVDLCIPLDVISRVHAQIRRTDEGVFVQDLNSTNGTYVNGQLLDPSQEKAVADGDTVAFAGVRFTVRYRSS